MKDSRAEENENTCFLTQKTSSLHSALAAEFVETKSETVVFNFGQRICERNE